MKYFIIILTYLFFQNNLSAQLLDYSDSVMFVKKNKCIYRVNLSAPFGVFFFGSAEIKLLKNVTVIPQLGISSTFAYSNFRNRTTINSTRDIASNIAFAAFDLRYYFNLNHRRKKQRNTDFFSGNYIALKRFFSTPPTSVNNQSFMYENMQSWQLHIGTQHTLNSKLTIGGNIGFILSESSLNKNLYTNTSLYPYFQPSLTIGYIL
jgi:hypothetical protein